DVAGQGVTVAVEELQCADEAGSVQVVAACVHPARGRGEIESGRLGHGQSVPVPAQEHGGPDSARDPPAAASAPHHDAPGQAPTRAHLDVEAFDGLEDELLCDRQVESDFDVLVQGAAECDQAGGDVVRVIGGGQVGGRGRLGGGRFDGIGK